MSLLHPRAEENKYFPPEAGIKAGGGAEGGRGGENQLVQSFFYQGGRGTGLSGRMNNEAHFQHIKGEGGDGGARLRCCASPWRIHRASIGVGGGARFGGGGEEAYPTPADLKPRPDSRPAKRAAR